MRTFLHKRVAEALRQIKREVRGGEAQWCFEIEGLPPELGSLALVDEIRSWKRDVLLAYFDVGDTVRFAAVDLGEIQRLVGEAVSSGRVVGLYDPTALGGCAFDFTDEGETVELLVTCWGSRESMADRLFQRFPEGHLFRGN